MTTSIINKCTNKLDDLVSSVLDARSVRLGNTKYNEKKNNETVHTIPNPTQFLSINYKYPKSPAVVRGLDTSSLNATRWVQNEYVFKVVTCS